MQVRERSRTELLLASKADWAMRMLAIFSFALILIPFGISGFEGYTRGRWVLYLLLLAGPSFFWQQDVRTSRIRFNVPPGQITVIYTPQWTTFVPGAAYMIKRTVHLPMPREDPRVVTRTGSYLDPMAQEVHRARPFPVFSVSVPTADGGTFWLYRGRFSSTANEIVSHIRWARQDLIRGRSMPTNPTVQPARG